MTTETFNDNVDAFVFTDTKGRKWDLSLNFGIAQRLRNSDFSDQLERDANGNLPEDKGVDLVNVTDGVIAQLISNENLLFAMVWCIVQDQCAANGLPEASEDENAEYEFMSGINGSIGKIIQNTLWESIADFRPQLGTVLSRSMSIKEKMEKMAPARIDRVLEEFEKQIGPALDQKVDEMQGEIQNSINESLGTTST